MRTRRLTTKVVRKAPIQYLSELVLSNSSYTIPLNFADVDTTDMFFVGARDSTGKDVLNDTWFTDAFASGGFKTGYWQGGAFTKYSHPIINDTTYIGGLGNGWNAEDPYKNCGILQGELCTSYTLEGENVDFFNSHMELIQSQNMENTISCNISTGSLEELYWCIDRTINLTAQDKIYIIFGLEAYTTQSTFWNSNAGNMVSLVYSWIEEIQQMYPTQDFVFIIDATALWNSTQGEDTWNSEILQSPELDLNLTGIRLYCHGFKLWNNALTGNPSTDIPIINTAIEETLPLFNQAIVSSGFNGCKVFIAQYSVSNGAYTEEVLKGIQYLCSVYPRLIKNFIEQARDSIVNYVGASATGVSQWISNTEVKTLDFKYLSIMNKLIESGTTALTCTYNINDVDIYGGKRGSLYCLIINNRSSNEVVLPQLITFDGNTHAPTVNYSIGEYCDNVLSTTSTSYTPNLIMKPYSINYIEIS